MTNISDVSSLSDTFRKRAEPPEQHIVEAESFLSRLAEAGSLPSEDDRSLGSKIFDALSAQTELYAFNASVLAGQETHSTPDLDHRIEQIQKGIEQAERTKERLSSALSFKTSLA